jgi:capsular exopolysaccharide synthesis family protein
MQIDEVVSMLMDEDESSLVIEPADKDDNTTLIQISYVSEDPDVAAKVVTAIVEGYESYLAEEFKTVGDEIETLIANAHSELASKLKTLTEDSVEFRRNNPGVIWLGGEATDPYAETFLKLLNMITEISTERTKLESVSTQAKESLRAGRSPESIFLLLSQNGASMGDLESPYLQRLMELDRPEDRLEVDSESARLERELLYPLSIREKVLLENFGEGHPSVSTVRKEIEGLREQIATLRESERRLDKEMERIRSEMQEKAGAGIKSVSERLAARLDALDEQIATLAREETALRTEAVSQQKMSRELQGMLSDHDILMAEMEGVTTLLTAYSEKLQEIDLMPKIGQRTLKRLNMPITGWFYGPTLPKYLLGGAAVGFILLSGLAVLMDLADRSYRNPTEIATDLGVTVLGHIPVMNIDRVKKTVEAVDPSVCTIHHAKGRVSEAYRSVRTGLYFSNRGKALKVLQVTSPVPGDGKSTLSSNISVTMAQSGRRVLLIDADLRRPRVAKIFGIDSEIGVAAVISGKVEIDDAIQVGPVANLFILPGGKRPSNPAEILSSERFKNMVEMLRDKFDVIVIDTPPLLAVSDPGAVAGIVDGVLMTMRLRRNVKPLAERAKAILDSVGANLLGVVINGVSSEAGYGYNYDYNDYRYAYKYGSNYRSGYGYRYGYGNYRYGYSEYADQQDLSLTDSNRS